jgi:hypothetical protein
MALLACAGDRPEELPAGAWGGEHVSLAVTAEGAVLEFDCAHGTIDEPPRLDSEGRFTLAGVYVRESGGPVRDDVPEDRHPASYAGRLEGSRLTFSVRLVDAGVDLGPFTAVLGEPATIFKCL